MLLVQVQRGLRTATPDCLCFLPHPFSTVAAPFYVPPATKEDPKFSFSSPTLTVLCHQPSRYEVTAGDVTCVMALTSLPTGEVPSAHEHALTTAHLPYFVSPSRSHLTYFLFRANS